MDDGDESGTDSLSEAGGVGQEGFAHVSHGAIRLIQDRHLPGSFFSRRNRSRQRRVVGGFLDAALGGTACGDAAGSSPYALAGTLQATGWSPSFFRIVIIGHQSVKADCSRFNPTKAVNSTQ